MKFKWPQDLNSQTYQDALAIRKAVFIGEQGVNPALEIDDKEKLARHLVAYRAGEPLACARLLPLSEETAKVQRVAVLKAQRDHGIGRELMAECQAYSQEQGFKELILHAQAGRENFYQLCGYQGEGDYFEEAGIPHLQMRLPLAEK